MQLSIQLSMQQIILLLIGFSLFEALLIASTRFRSDKFENLMLARIVGIGLLLVLAGLQLAHYFYFLYDSHFVFSPYYSCLLLVVAPTFYLLSKALLKVDNHPRTYKNSDILHFLPSTDCFIYSTQNAN